MARKIAAELLGTALLVFFAVGVATLSFGFGIAGSSFAAGVVATALAFGLTLLVLVYVLGPISGCHVNPAVKRLSHESRPSCPRFAARRDHEVCR